MNFLLNLKPSTAHTLRTQIEDEGAMWANRWYALMKPFIWLASYLTFYGYSEGSFNFRRLPLSGQIIYFGQKLDTYRKSDIASKRKWCGLGIGSTFYGGSDGADRSFQFHIKLILFAVYLTFENVLPKRFQPHYESKYGYGSLPSSREFRFYYHERAIWLNLWNNEDDHHAKQTWINQMHVFHLPWDYDWVRTSRLLKNQMWLHEKKGSREDWKFHRETKEILWKESHPYQYTLKSGEVQNITATIGVSEREWNWRWFKWLGFPRKISRTIDVEFSDEVGEGRGSWKGGTIGCSYGMLKDEAPVETLRRMEKERKFDR